MKIPPCYRRRKNGDTLVAVDDRPLGTHFGQVWRAVVSSHRVIPGSCVELLGYGLSLTRDYVIQRLGNLVRFSALD